MGLSQLWKEIVGEQAPETAPPAPTADDQTLYGNAFVGEMLGGQEPLVARKGIGDIARSSADQVHARVELEGKFDTENPLGSEGRAAISDEELDEMVELYSDIRLGNTNLKLDTSGMNEEDAAKFRAGAMGDVAKLMQTESGRRMLRDLAHNEKGIQTSIGKSPGTEGPETDAYLEGGRDCKESNARDRLGDPTGWCIDDRAHDGKGVDSIVRYRPGETTTTAEGQSPSDVTLYHELTHAMHNMHGDQARGSVPSATDSTRSIGNDEFQATGLGPWAYKVDEHGELVPNENLYRAERRDLGEDLQDRPTYGGTSPQ